MRTSINKLRCILNVDGSNLSFQIMIGQRNSLEDCLKKKYLTVVKVTVWSMAGCLAHSQSPICLSNEQMIEALRHWAMFQILVMPPILT